VSSTDQQVGPGRLVSADCKLVLTVRIGVLNRSTGWCLSSWCLKNCKWVLTTGIGVPHRLKPVKNVTLDYYKKNFLWFSPLLGFHVKYCVLFLCVDLC
jgi:hypothetical protein